MNVYARYFDNEVLTTSLDQLMSFVSGIDGLIITPNLHREIEEYVQGKFFYAKRFKVNARSYFILIKTQANSLQEFKENANREDNRNKEDLEREKEQFFSFITSERIGWYQASITFNRVVPVAQTGKCRYVSTPFKVRLKANSIQHCYDRVLAYLKSREDIDSRSQFPSIKSRNFVATFEE